MPLLDYRFSVGDTVWVVDGLTTKQGVIQHIEYDNFITDDVTQERLRYIVLLSSPHSGTIIALTEDTFSSLDDALYELAIRLGVTPTPTPSATPF